MMINIKEKFINVRFMFSIIDGQKNWTDFI